jgi:hypothetical protein
MQIVGVRFGHKQRQLIQKEAAEEGVSESQFIRDAAYARAVLYAAQRKDSLPQLWLLMAEIVQEAGSADLIARVHAAMADPE